MFSNFARIGGAVFVRETNSDGSFLLRPLSTQIEILGASAPKPESQGARLLPAEETTGYVPTPPASKLTTVTVVRRRNTDRGTVGGWCQHRHISR